MINIKIGASEDRDEARVNQFGSATFECKVRPSTRELSARIVGTITQSRKKYWIVSKPNRQVGDKPRERVSVSLNADVAKAIREWAEQRQTTVSAIAEDAIKDYLGLDDAARP